MNTMKKQKNFSMKYCPSLEDHVVVMTTAQGEIKNQSCLSSHLCQTDVKASCGHENSSLSNENAVFAEGLFGTEKKHLL